MNTERIMMRYVFLVCLTPCLCARSCQAAFNGHCSSAGGAHKSNYFFLARSLVVEGGDDGDRSEQMVHIKSHDCPELCLARLGAGRNLRVGLASCTGASRTTVEWVRA